MAGTSNLEADLKSLLTLFDDSSKTNWTVARSSLGGRGLFSTQPIKSGDLILSNKPLVIGPRADCTSEYFCTVCYEISDFCFRCDKCLLLVCSSECKESNAHDIECSFIIENWIPKPNLENYSNALARVLIHLRSLLLTEEQKIILKMFQRNKTKSNTEKCDALINKYVVPHEHIDSMNIASSVLKINSFRIACEENKIKLRGLYPLSAFLNHSCVPNTRNVFKKDYTMKVYATKDIGIDEEILTCYTGILWSTPARRLQLYKMKGFWCYCKRCDDRNEMGTKLASLKCLDRECNGVLLPAMPTDPKTEWTCDDCDMRVTPDRISTIQGVLGSLVGTLNLDDEIKLESVILERLSTFVPYSSHIFVDLRLRLALKIGFVGGLKLKDLSQSRLALKESLCRGTLRTLAALGAGDAHLRGLLLYHLHAALAERARRCPDQYEELKTEIERTIDQAYQILQGDISAPPDLELRRRYLGPGCDKPQEERFFILDA